MPSLDCAASRRWSASRGEGRASSLQEFRVWLSHARQNDLLGMAQGRATECRDGSGSGKGLFRSAPQAVAVKATPRLWGRFMWPERGSHGAISCGLPIHGSSRATRMDFDVGGERRPARWHINLLELTGHSPPSAGNQHFHVDCEWPVWTGANHVREDLFPHRLTLVGGKRNIYLARHARALLDRPEEILE